MTGSTRQIVRACLAALALAAPAGCAYRGEARDFDPAELDTGPGWVAATGVPLIRQKADEDCGVAALSMVLDYWKASLSEEALAESDLLIPGKGARAKDLRDLARTQGLQSFLVHGRWEDLLAEIGLGRPVIVGLVKPTRSGAQTHYEVVVALHPEREIVVTHDPAAGWRQNSRSGFLKEWDPAGYLTLVFFRGDPRDTKP